MELIHQKQVIDQLDYLAKQRRNAILISGNTGTGKTYLAQLYAKLLNISDFQLINPNVNDIRSAFDDCVNIDNNIVICIENLDMGLLTSSYTLLKSLEEPKSNVYVIVTCRNVNQLPDTILSRVIHVNIGPPTKSDIDNMIKHMNLSVPPNLYSMIHNYSDIVKLSKLDTDSIVHLNKLESMSWNKPVNSIVWELLHTSSGKELPIDIVLTYLLNMTDDLILKKKILNSLKDISSNRLSTNAILNYLVMSIKYNCK